MLQLARTMAFEKIKMFRFSILMCFVVGSLSQVVDFMGNPTNINENAGTVTFSLMSDVNVRRDVEVDIRVDTASTAATGFDFGGTGTYTATIPNGMMAATLVLAVENDDLEEVAEIISLRINSVGAGATAGTTTQTASTTINVDAADAGNKVQVDFAQSVYEFDESAGASTVTLRFTDANGQPTVLNGAESAALATPGSGATDTAEVGAGNDYTTMAGMITFTFDTVATSVDATVTINDDSVMESTEYFRLGLGNFASGTLAEIGSTRPETQIRIRDNDLESLICTAKPEVNRRTQADFELYAFTSLATDRASIAWSKAKVQGSLTDFGTNGKKLTVARPNKVSSRRFGEYTFTATGTSGASLTCQTFIKSKSDILNYPAEVARKYTMVIYPDTEGGTTLSPRVCFGIDYDKPKSRNKIKWRKDGQLLRRQRRPIMWVTTTDAAGTYMISRDNRGDAWFAIIELILSDCPRNQYLSGTCMDCGKCYNGGVCDGTLGGNCICPPCFEGNQCELVATDVGGFGQSTRFTCSSLGCPTTCEGVLFTLPGIYGSSCGCGWSGTDCKTKCKEGTFGADCAQTCHCMTVANCDYRTGVCSDGICEAGYFGENCQRV